MRRILLFTAFIFLFIHPASAGDTPVRIGGGFDPRTPLRVIVLPAEITARVGRVDPRTVSALFATELVQKYDVLDLDLFERYLQDNRLTLDDAISARGRSVMLDSAHVNAVVMVEVYRWDEGKKGGLFGGKKGVLGMRVRLTDPFTGQIIWSLNRLVKVKANTNFLEAVTAEFTRIVADLDRDMKRAAKKLKKEEKRSAKKKG